MTFDDDFIQLEFRGGTKRILCSAAGIQWPPPPELDVDGFRMRLESMSRITDEQRSGLTRLCRGAVYVVHENQPVESFQGPKS